MVSMEDLVVLRRKYDGATYMSQGNEALDGSLQVMQEMYTSLQKAMEVSNKIHGLFTQKNAMLATKSAEQAQKDCQDKLSRRLILSQVMDYLLAYEINKWSKAY